MRIFQMYCKYVRKQDEHDTFRGTDKTLKSLINCPWRVLFYLDYKQEYFDGIVQKFLLFERKKTTLKMRILLERRQFSRFDYGTK